MSILAAINHRITLIASGIAAVVALIALALPSSKSSPASAERAPAVAESHQAPAMADVASPASPLPRLDFDDATAAVAELPAGDHVHQASPLALPPIEPAGDSVVQTQATAPAVTPIASPTRRQSKRITLPRRLSLRRLRLLPPPSRAIRLPCRLEK